ncbi:MAG: hypothetical protein IK130_11595 [Oscillospiraceae bacterium]|nr:hypothetical protein [Oscillospiraceae bacterium]
MNSFEFLQKLDGISPEFIEESLGTDISEHAAVPQIFAAVGSAETVRSTDPPDIKAKRGILHTAVSYISLAACLVVAVGAAFLFHNLHGHNTDLLESSTPDPAETTQPLVTVTALQTDLAQQSETTHSTVTYTQITSVVSDAEFTADSSLGTLNITELSADNTLPERTEATDAVISGNETETADTPDEQTETETAAETTVETTAEITTAASETEAPEQTTENTEATTSAPETTHSEPHKQITPGLGDLDGDGLITEADTAILYCTIARESCNGKRFISEELFPRADFNQDGNVTYADQICATRYIALYWYIGYRNLSVEKYIADLNMYNQLYLMSVQDLPPEFGDLWQEAAFVLTINESAVSNTSELTYETRCEESEAALQTVRDEYQNML